MNLIRAFQLIVLVHLLGLLAGGTATAAVDGSLLAGLEARNIGIAATSGRISALDALVSNPNHIVAGAATGGVWLSKNGGLNWEPIFDDQPVASIGALAINQSNPDIIWVGTGESNVRNSTSIGGGVFKSADGGKSWKRVGLENSERIDRIALHPDNPDIAYVAALGTLWGPNTERGIYKTVDGGQNWQRVLYVDDTTGGTDVKLDPANPHKIYAAMWQFRRWPYHFKSGGPGSGLYVSHDAGATWQQKTQEDGLPEGDLGRMVIAPSPADASRVYLLVEAEKSALLRSDDGGDSWQAVNTEYNVADRPFYYTELFADPVNPDRIYNVSTRLRVSIDGGKNFEFNPGVDCCAHSNNIHIDNHAFWINPADPRHIILGNDGGLAITRDRGDTWRFVRNLALTQFYHIAVDNDHPYNVYGGLQDNGSWRGPAEIWQSAGIRNFHWNEVGFGDGFDVLPDPRNSRRGYSMSQGGFLYRWNLDSGDLRLIRPAPPTPETVLRFNWNAALAIDPFDPDTLYYGSQFVHKSTDRGDSWTVISPDLTTNNPEFQTFRESGGITPDVTAAENYTTLVSLAPSPLEAGVIWAGSDDGRVHITRDGGESWARIDEARGVPGGAWVAMIHPSPHDPAVAHLVFDDHRRSDMKPYVFRVENYGRRWRNLTTDALSGYALSVLQDHEDPSLLFVGTEFGLFFSTSGGDAWTRFNQGVPTVSVMDMAIQARENDLVLGTHGRGVFVIDDYRALRGLDEEVLDQRFALLSASDGQQYDPVEPPSSRFTGSGEFRGPNETYGVLMTFVASGNDLPHPDDDRERQRKADLRAAKLVKDEMGAGADESDEAADEEEKKLQMTVRDSDGEIVRQYKFKVHQGLNRIAWDLQSDGVRPAPGPEPAKLDDGLPAGAEVAPGQYEITLAFDDITQTTGVQVLHDPRSEYSVADRQQNYAALKEMEGLRERAVTVLEKIVRSRDDVKTITRLMDQRDDESLEDLEKAAGDITKRLNELEKTIRVPAETKGIVYDDDKLLNVIGLAQFYVGSTLGAPIASARRAMEAAASQVADAEDRWASFVNDELAPFTRRVMDAKIGLLTDYSSDS